MSKARIMIVEDEPIVSLEIQDTLERLGYEIPVVLDSGDAVLESCMRYKPDLILMDIRLKSFIDGIDAARRLRMVSMVPIIYLSAYTGEDTRNRAEKTQPAAFLSKPLDEKLLHEKIEQILRNRPKEVPNLA